MANKKITELNELSTTGDSLDVIPVVDLSANETKKIKLSNLPISAATQTELNEKANSSDVYTKTEINQKIKRAKKTVKVQLDTPTPNPSISAGAAHTYSINLGEEFEQVALTKFQWVVPSLDDSAPDSVLANAIFSKDEFGGVLIANKTPGGWVRSFEIDSTELQGTNPNDVAADFGASKDEVTLPLGSGTNSLNVPLDHLAVETNPPKKLHIEDVYLDGTFLKVTVKNYDSVSIDLSPYVGLTALYDSNRQARFGCVSDGGAIAYAPNYIAPHIRVSEDGGKEFFDVYVPPIQPGQSDLSGRNVPSMAMTSDGVNTFLCMFNYNYIMAGSSPSYNIQKKYNIKTSLPSSFGFDAGNYWGNRPGKQIDWKKSATESCMIFTGFLNYYTMVAYKSVDDGVSFGNNAPLFNNNEPIFTAGENPIGAGNANLSDYQSIAPERWIRFEPRVVNNNIHYLSLTYTSKTEEYNSTMPVTRLELGEHTFTSLDGKTFSIRPTEIALKYPYVIVSALGKLEVSNSTLGNNGVAYSTSYYNSPKNVYYTGSQTVGHESVSLNGHEIAILKSDYDTLDVVVGDYISISPYFENKRLVEVRDAQIYGVEYKILLIGAFSSGSYSIAYDYFPTAGNAPTPAVQASLTIQNLIFTAVTGGSSGNNISIEIIGGGTQGSEVVSRVGDAITIQIEDTVSTAQDIANVFAETDVTLNISGYESQTMTVESVQNLSGGSDLIPAEPLAGVFSTIFKGVRDTYYNGEWLWVYPTDKTFTPEDDTTSPSLELVFKGNSNVVKSAVMKTSDGGATWSHVNQDDEFRYCPSHVFYSSSNGQELLLGAIKYWNKLSYEKWDYPVEPNRMGSDVRFNYSANAGSTWRNATGNWDEVTVSAFNEESWGTSPTGQVIGKIGDVVQAVLFNYSQVPVLHRSLDLGVTWQTPVKLTQLNPVYPGFMTWGSDAKGDFMGFFGTFYQSGFSSIEMVYYGSTVEKFTQWQAYGVK